MPEPTSLERLLAAIGNLGQAVSEVVVNPNALKLEGKTLDEVITQALAGKASEAGTADNALLLQDKTVNDIVAMVTKTTVGLSNVQNYDIASTQDVTTGTASDKYMTVVRTKQMVNEAVTALVNGAPTALDTLKEIADKLAEDDDTIAALLSSLDNKLDKTGIAADTSLFQGFTLAQVIAQALAGKAATAGNADTATKLATARTINGVSFNGTANITIADSTKEPAIAAGTSAQFWSGVKSWVDFATTVRGSVLTGISFAVSTAVVATDTLLAALGKLQAQITALQSSKLDATATAAAATKLATSRTLNLTGDGTASMSFDGTANASGVLTLAASGVTAGTYGKVTVNAKGLVTGGAALAPADIPNIETSQVNGLDTALAGKLASGATAVAAVKLATARTLSLTGDATGSMSFDGSANASAALTLVNSGVTAGTYGKVTVNAKGIVTAGAGLAASDIPNLDAGKITSGSIPVARGGTGGTDQATARSGLGIGSMATRNVTISTAAPSGGADGDIWIQYS